MHTCVDETCTCAYRHYHLHAQPHTRPPTDNAASGITAGTYDPIPKKPKPGDVETRPFKDIKLDRPRAQYWLGVGAQPTDTMWRLLSMVGILEPRYRIQEIAASAREKEAKEKKAAKDVEKKYEEQKKREEEHIEPVIKHDEFGPIAS
ncbi:hypothetical protein IWX50DRAFT_612735 [Phyllosticta citricarpa]